MTAGRSIILIAPNVSEQMGGEGIKALQIFQELKKVKPDTIQITHERNEHEIRDRLGLADVAFVRDTIVSKLIWRSVIFRLTLEYWFSRKAVKLAEQLAEARGLGRNDVVIHHSEPNSPVIPRHVSRKYMNVFGPINGNIYYPEIFRDNEKLKTRLRRVLHFPVQRFNRIFFRGMTKADLILVAGGERTRVSLQSAGCPDRILADTLDCGIKDAILDRPRVRHSGSNPRFVHFGRLVFHKGTALIIQSLVKTKHPVTLDVVGTGPELERCQQLVIELGLQDRVKFLGWYTSHSDLLDSFDRYRGVVLPSIEDANGIVIQEAMAIGLPPICLDWGGPQLLIENAETGYLVPPVSLDRITTELAEKMDRLSEDGELAERFSVAGRATAESWRWSRLTREWVALINALNPASPVEADSSRRAYGASG